MFAAPTLVIKSVPSTALNTSCFKDVGWPESFDLLGLKGEAVQPTPWRVSRALQGVVFFVSVLPLIAL